uniref:Uncharacterized protein n=1 Tax=Nicotiana tabacum TaxID=4097 RepID=A0A1S3Y9H3_TOBAC
MAEEFQESEVIFQENITKHEVDERNEEYYDFQNTKKLPKRKKQKRISNSVPVNIPENLSRNNSWVKCVKNEDESDGEMVPRHIITGRRIAGKMMTFSVCTGYGRTLKGRDLSQ